MSQLGRPGSSRLGDEHRVQADVDGLPVVFTSRDAPLRPSPEAFASAMLIPALHHGEVLRVEAPLDRRWLKGAAAAARLTAAWWDYEPHRVAARRALPGLTRRVPDEALCFTLGVDSFHVLMQHRPRPSTICFVQGYDVALDDHPRAAAVEARIRQVGDALGVRAVILRTDLRENPLFASVTWEYTHGGALAAAGHLLGGIAGTLLIAGTFSPASLRPWGSHRDLDSCWSSRRMRIEHADQELARESKLFAIAHEPLVQANLRVCWEHLTGDLNCSRCDKCVSSMVILDAAGVLDRFATFAPERPLPALIDELPTTRYLNQYARLIRTVLRGDVAAAAGRLLERSTP